MGRRVFPLHENRPLVADGRCRRRSGRSVAGTTAAAAAAALLDVHGRPSHSSDPLPVCRLLLPLLTLGVLLPALHARRLSAGPPPGTSNTADSCSRRCRPAGPLPLSAPPPAHHTTTPVAPCSRAKWQHIAVGGGAGCGVNGHTGGRLSVCRGGPARQHQQRPLAAL